MKSRVWPMVGGLVLAGCLNPVEEVECTTDVDCGHDMSCVASRCAPSARQQDAGHASVDGGSHDGGTADSGAADAAVSDAGAFDAGTFDAGPPRCSTTNPCLPTGYKFELAPECGVFCYYDEAHNLAMNGPGQGQNPAGFAQYASGQLLDGVRGNADWTVNAGFEWVGWLYRDASIVFRLATSHEFSAVSVGFNNRGSGTVSVPPEIRIQFGDDGVTFGSAFTFRSADGTLPSVPVGIRQDVVLAVAGATGRFIRVTLVNPSAWSMVDEFEFD